MLPCFPIKFTLLCYLSFSLYLDIFFSNIQYPCVVNSN